MIRFLATLILYHWIQSFFIQYCKFWVEKSCYSFAILLFLVKAREGVVPSPTSWCSSYRKGSLRVTLDYGCQLYFILVKAKFAIISNRLFDIKHIVIFLRITSQSIIQLDEYCKLNPNGIGSQEGCFFTDFILIKSCVSR